MAIKAIQREIEGSDKVLPGSRLVFDKQVEALRAYGKLGRPTKNKELAQALQLNETTLSDANGFFLSAGLIQRGEGGYVASEALTAYARAYEWKPDTAGTKLAGPISSSWFYKALLTRIHVRAISEDEAIETLAEASSAGPKNRAQLAMLLDYLDLAGLTRRTADGKISGSGLRHGGNEDRNEKHEEEHRKDKDVEKGTERKPEGGLPATSDRAKLATMLLEVAVDEKTPNEILDSMWKVIKYLKGVPAQSPRDGAEKGEVPA